MSRHPPEADMTPRIPENVPTWLADLGLVTIMGDMLPPRDTRTRKKSRRSLANPKNSSRPLGHQEADHSPASAYTT